MDATRNMVLTATLLALAIGMAVVAGADPVAAYGYPENMTCSQGFCLSP